jgi:hypothetical protein
MAYLTEHKMGSNPTVAQPEKDFVIPHNMHGDVVYISKAQQTEFRLFIGGAVLMFAASVALTKIWKIPSGELWTK